MIHDKFLGFLGIMTGIVGCCFFGIENYILFTMSCIAIIGGLLMLLGKLSK